MNNCHPCFSSSASDNYKQTKCIALLAGHQQTAGPRPGSQQAPASVSELGAAAAPTGGVVGAAGGAVDVVLLAEQQQRDDQADHQAAAAPKALAGAAGHQLARVVDALPPARVAPGPEGPVARGATGRIEVV